MKPLASAQGMSAPGMIVPRPGTSQRSKASNPSRRPVERSTAGWKTSAGEPSMPRSGTARRRRANRFGNTRHVRPIGLNWVPL